MIRVYGHRSGSFATVTDGLCLGFSELGVLDGCFIGEQQDFDSEPVPGAFSPVAVVVGDPLRALLAHTHGQHQEIWLMLAPNSLGVPPRLKQELVAKRGKRKTVEGLLAPSKWAADVLRREFPELPVELCQHGVLPQFMPTEKEHTSAFSVLHVTSTNLQRKSTLALMEAWNRLSVDGTLRGADLWISCNPLYAAEFERFSKTSQYGHPTIHVLNGQSWGREEYVRSLNRMHLIAQPSRAEGFGLVPLEARACGVPVLMTCCTGHADQVVWDSQGVEVVTAGPPEESDDFWGAEAPAVALVDIQAALRHAYLNLDVLAGEARSIAAAVSEYWTWRRGASAVVDKWKKKYGNS